MQDYLSRINKIKKEFVIVREKDFAAERHYPYSADIKYRARKC